MLHNYKWGNNAPTQSDLELIENVENNPDPTTRLKPISQGKNYFNIKKQWICHKYQIAIEQDESVEDARIDFYNELKELEKLYEIDLTLWLELKKATSNIWSI